MIYIYYIIIYDQLSVRRVTSACLSSFRSYVLPFFCVSFVCLMSCCRLCVSCHRSFFLYFFCCAVLSFFVVIMGPGLWRAGLWGRGFLSCLFQGWPFETFGVHHGLVCWSRRRGIIRYVIVWIIRYILALILSGGLELAKWAREIYLEEWCLPRHHSADWLFHLVGKGSPGLCFHCFENISCKKNVQSPV